MEVLNKISLVIILSVGYYFLFTLPNLTLILFDFGLKYPLWLNVVFGLISSILANITLNKVYK